MDFAEVVAQHLAWKQRLRRILLGRERRRQPERTEAIAGQLCPLDPWLKEELARHPQEPLLLYLDEQHRLSHDLAIQMVLEEAAARTSMDRVFQIGQFQNCSRNLLEALENLRRKYALSEVPLCVIPPGFPREEFPPVPDARG